MPKFCSAAERRQAQRDVDGEAEAHAPVLAVEQGEQAQHEQPIRDQADQEARQEAGKLSHIAVDALDQLAGRVALVEGHVEPQTVQREIVPQRVRRLPAQIEPDIARAQVDGALREPQAR